MANHPLNLALRFLLELAALFALGYWGWTRHQGALRFLLAFGLPVLAAVLWATFSVPGDRPGTPPVPVAGWVRLLLELAFFAGAVWALAAAERRTWALVLAVLLVVHYALSSDRLLELLRR